METRGIVRGFPKESEFPVTMQAITLDSYQISFLGGTYTFNKKDIFYADKKEDISWAVQEILGCSKKYGLTQISFCIMSMLGYGFNTSMWIFVLDAEFKTYSRINEDAVITFYEVNIGKKINYYKDIYVKNELYEFTIEKDEPKEEQPERLVINSLIRDQWNELLRNHSSKDAMVNNTKTSYVDYLQSMLERRAIEDIDSGRFPIKKRSNKKKTIRNWIADFKNDKLLKATNRDRISDVVNGNNLHNNRRLMLITAYYLNMSFDETRTLFELGDEKFEPANDNELAILVLLRDGIYDNAKNAKIIDEMLEKNNCFDIYEMAGFKTDKKEKETKNTKNKKISKNSKCR